MLTFSLPPIGLRHQRTITVDPTLTVPALPPAMGDFTGFPPVLATPHLICLVESACIEVLQPYLLEGWMTVGTRVEMSHLAATPVGRRVTAKVELAAIEGRTLRFAAECHDEQELIGKGFHERMVVDRSTFVHRVNKTLGR